MAIIPREMQRLADELGKTNNRRSETVRTILEWFGAQRRRPEIVQHFRIALNQLGLRTQPDFRYAYIDEPITFFREATSVRLAAEATTAPIVADGNGSEDQMVDSPLPDDDASGNDPVHSSIKDPTFRVGRLAAANSVPVTLTSSDKIETAVTLMLENNFDQIAIVEKGRKVLGKVTWSGVAKRLLLVKPGNSISDYLQPCEVVDNDLSLADVIDIVLRKDCVLVRGPLNTITGIVTLYDLSVQYNLLSEPFLLLGEIENHIRTLLNGRFSSAELQAARNPNDVNRSVADVSDLTLGECLRLIERPEYWTRLELLLDRKKVLETLGEVRIIRNEVMHFDPDGIEPASLSLLRRTVSMLQEVAKLLRLRLA